MDRFIFLITCTLCSIGLPLWGQLPDEFVEIEITDEIYRPVGIEFDDNGQAYVWERSGVVHIIDSSGQHLPTPLLDISEEVGNWGDHGCLGFALDPAFLSNGFIYLLYAVDRHYLLHFGTSSYDPDSTLANQATIGRLARYTADPASNFTSIIDGSRKVLLGESIGTGIPILFSSHGVGSLAFGTDGTLLVSTGDGSSFLSNDIGNADETYFAQGLDDGIISADENVGAFRAQMVDNLNGKILRIDPTTGDGIASNPFFDPGAPRSAHSRMWALGLRNPFRMIVKPNSGSHSPSIGDPGILMIGDVGSNKWEELNIADKPGMNFGFPLFEGYLQKAGFWGSGVTNPDAPNPLSGSAGCDRSHFLFEELIVQKSMDAPQFPNPCNSSVAIPANIPHFEHSIPAIAYANQLGNKPVRAQVSYFNDNMLDTINISVPDAPATGEDFGGYSSIAGCFYEGTAYPEVYQGQYFHADYSWWIRTMSFDDNWKLTSVEKFHDHADYVLSVAYNPKDECLYYVGLQSQIMRIEYGGNAPPVAVIKADQQFGPTPLTVQFDASNSYDPEGTALKYAWDFGNGQTSEAIAPSIQFESPNAEPLPFMVQLTVTDSLEARDSVQMIISLNNTPPVAEISSIIDSSYYPTRDFTLMALRAEVDDLEFSASELSYKWETFLQHNTHDHSERIDTSRNSQTLIEPIGCNDEIYWYRIVLEVTDPAGLSGHDTVNIFPNCAEPAAELDPWYIVGTDEAVELRWSSRFEDDLVYYEIQKFTSSGYDILGQREARGSGSDYTFRDQPPTSPTTLTYRLLLQREDGTYDYSETRSITYPLEPEFVLFPNPTSNTLNLQFRNYQTEVRLEVYDAAGRRVLIEEQAATQGFTISVQGWPDGIYTYRLWHDQRQTTSSFTKISVP